MKLLLNDTSRYHHGSAEVVRNIDFDLALEAPPDSIKFSSLAGEKITCVILNGEGTLHHDSSIAHQWLSILKEAQAKGIPTIILNTVWQQMHKSTAKILERCERIEVREILSQHELRRIGIEAHVIPDRSIRTDVEITPYDYQQIYYGQPFNANLSTPSQYPEINIFSQSWNEVVNRLRNSSLLVTGRHHEMYAAIKARCKFIVKPGNTWKNLGVFASSAPDLINIPLSIEDVLSGKYDEEYEKIFDWAEKTFSKDS